MSIFVYQCLLDHLTAIVSSNGNDTFLPAPPVLEQLRHRFKLDELLETYHMPPILALLRCQEPRTALLEIAQQLGLKYSPDVLSAVRLDEERIAAHITYIMDIPEANEEALALRRDEAQRFIDVLDQVLSGHLAGMYRMYPLDISKTHRFMLKLSQFSEQLPHTIFIHSISDCDRFYRERGGFGEIYRASYKGRTVALKRLSTSLTADVDDQRKARLRFCQEVLIWRRLQHPFILPLLGIDRETFQPSLAMVSPWMEQGTALNHAKKNGLAVVEKLLFQVAQGLAYLHSMTVVHGDLRGSNILISDDMTARLTDFGLTVFADNHETANPSTTNRAGSIQWMAPELIDPGGFGCSRFLRTTASDAYAFACVCIELYTGLPPFAGLSDATALLQIIAGKRPSRPDELTSDMLWNVITQLWADSKEARPSIDSVVDSLEILCHTPRTPVEDPQISSLSIINQIEHIDTLLPPPTSTTLKLSVESNQTMSSYASTNSEFMAAHFPRRFFVVKCPSERIAERSKELGMWAVSAPDIELVINQAYRTSNDVFLIFSAVEAKEFYGYARMQSAPSETAEQSANDLLLDEKMRKISIELGVVPSPHTAGVTISNPFRVTWLATTRIPFLRTRHIRNSWNHDREVRLSKDGTEVNPDSGEAMLKLWTGVESVIEEEKTG